MTFHESLDLSKQGTAKDFSKKYMVIAFKKYAPPSFYKKSNLKLELNNESRNTKLVLI